MQQHHGRDDRPANHRGPGHNGEGADREIYLEVSWSRTEPPPPKKPNNGPLEGYPGWAGPLLARGQSTRVFTSAP